ncbi:TPA: restriction endonuclease subunit S [Vibrio vulnificus]|nr:restriction endonuclease subunit S [Vibrio vulnificus]
MSFDWPIVRLENVTSRIGDGLHGTPKYDDNGDYYFINGNNLSNGRIVINEKTKRTDKEQYLKHKKDINDRTLFVSINGTLGNIATYREEKIILGKSACYLNVLPEVDKDYIKYVLTSKHFQDYIHNLATGSTIKNVGLKLIREYEFRLPELAVQKEVSNILNAIDFKIENNTQTNQTLEQMAQAIFKSWFVDFDPVKAKIEALAAGGSADDAELAAISVISAKTLDELNSLKASNPEAFNKLAQTAALFPAAMQDSELGEIPEGWEVKQLKDILELAYGKALKKTDRVDGDVPVYGSGGLTGYHNQSLVEGPGIIVGRKGTVGSVYWEPKAFYPIDTVFYVKPRAGYSLKYCHLVLQNLGLKDMNTDAAVPGLNRDNAYRLDVITPTKGVMNLFKEIMQSLQSNVDANNAQSASLESLRDTLLPKLLSGEIDLTSEVTA